MKKTYAFNSVEGDRKYNADNIAEDKAIFYSDGVVVQGGNVITTQLQVGHVLGMQVMVNNGIGIIKGRTITFDGTADGSELVTLPQAHLTLDRIDRVVLELNLTDGVRDIVLKSIQGTPDASPAAPTLIRTEEVYQISLAQISVIANSGTIGTITDERSNTSVCGISNVTIGITPPTGNDAVTVTLSTERQTQFNSANVDDALGKSGIQLSSYITFCGNVNANMLDASFGKNNEDCIGNLGEQLARYAWFKGENKATNHYVKLRTKKTFLDCLADTEALGALVGNDNLSALVTASPYASNLYSAVNIATFTDEQMKQLICGALFLNPNNYANLSALLANSTVSTAVFNTGALFNLVSKNDLALSKGVAGYLGISPTGYSSLSATFSDSTVMTAFVSNATLCAKFVSTIPLFSKLVNNVSDANVPALEASTTFRTASTNSPIKTSGSYNGIRLNWGSIYGNKCFVLTATDTVPGTENKMSALLVGGGTINTTFSANTPVNRFFGSVSMYTNNGNSTTSTRTAYFIPSV